MRILTHIILLFAAFIFALPGYSQTPLKEIIKAIEANSDYSFVYNEKLDLEQRRAIAVDDLSIPQSLDIIFRGTGISWQVIDKHIVLSKAKRITVSGYVTDNNSMETLIGASIINPYSNEGCFTNAYGYYSIQVDADSVWLQASYIGYKPLTKAFFAQRDTIVNFGLSESDTMLPDVVVYNIKSFSPAGGVIEMTASDIRPTPSAFGENDILKSLQTLPGIRGGVEGTAGINVRGGSPDQNLILIDGVPVYNTGHVWSIISVFNGDAVKKLSLHKGSFPARFGGRLSSVVDVRFKDGDMQQFHGDVTIGTLAARVNVEGPIVKEKTSFSLSARRSYIDAFLRPLRKFSNDPTIPVFYMYDINAKVNHKFSDRSRLYLSYYKGIDRFLQREETERYEDERLMAFSKSHYDYRWGNDIVSLRWNYVFSNRLFMNATAAYNKYKYDFNLRTEEKYEEKEQKHTRFQRSDIRDLQFSVDLEYQPDNNHYIRFGGGLTLHHFSPEMHGYQLKETSNNNQEWKQNYYLYNKINGQEMSLYAEDEFAVTKRLKANLGAHFSLFQVQGKTYFDLQPRLSLGYELTPKMAAKASYTKMNQYVHLLSSNTISQPSDLWVPITKNLKPMSSRQLTAGLFFDTKTGYNFSVEGFYKRMNNLLEYKDGAAWKDASTSWEEYVEPGKGWAYGMELFAQKTKGRFTGRIGYTLSWNRRQFDTINQGRRFWAKYDGRHNIDITGTFKLNDKIDFTVSWMYVTGSRCTLPLEMYQPLVNPGQKDEPTIYWYASGNPVEYVGERNNYKMSDIHHLDIEMRYYRSPRKVWAFSIYNVYNHFNPYIVRNGGFYNTVKEHALLGIVPSISFTYKFK
jgi:Outer membrane receptor for ferrienterochelin and colicins